MNLTSKKETPSSSPSGLWQETLHKKYFKQGVGLIIKHADRYLFAIGKESFWQQDNQQQVITYTAVGGTRELSESFLDCAYREAKEELGVDVEIFGCRKSIFYDFETKKKKKLILRETKAPWLVYSMPLTDKQGLAVCVYLAQLKNNSPRPSMEVPALILLTPGQVINCGSQTLSTLLNEGAEISEQREIPRNAIIKPFGTAEILQTLSLKELISIQSHYKYVSS